MIIERRYVKGKPTYWFWCPGCECYHYFDERWKFNDDYEKPTFEPSLVSGSGDERCHLFLTDGVLRYLNDCSHSLSGTSQKLPEVS